MADRALASSIFGSSLKHRHQEQQQQTSKHVHIIAMAPKKKVNSYDENWTKKWYGAGFFGEDAEVADVNIIKNVEKKKILSKLEKSGILSKAQNAGLTLTRIEELGLLSKAEDLGLLSFAESFVTSSPPVLASWSLPLLVAALVTVIAIPDDSSVLVAVQNVVALLLATSGVLLFVSSIILSGLQEED